MGFFTSSMAATPPASRFASIRAASIWMRPSIRMRDPVPALSLGSSSRTTIDSTTASSALPPRRRTAIPTTPAAAAASRTDAFEPAPQCVRRIGCTRLPGLSSHPSSFANSRLRRLRKRREAGLQIRDPTSELVANRTQIVHRLSGRTGNRPVLSFVLRADRTSVEASERDDPRRAGDHLRGHRPRGLRAEADPDLLEQTADHRVDRGRGFDDGKPTMRRILTGQLTPTEGTARVLDLDVVREPLRVKSLIGIVPEVESPPSYLTAYEYLYFVGQVRKVEGLEGRIARWFEFFDLDEARSSLCKDLSKGTRQKLMLAAAFLHEPSLVFLDEPFINLDPIYQRKMREFLQDYIGGGGTVFMASHLLDIAEKLCDRVAVIQDGAIVATGSVDEIRGPESNLETAFLRIVGA